ncbi:MAG: hypothetical protein BWY73_00079 [candidate division TA06 bacterium ADurb.Bin417]|uniref:Uncharacterized protein n=1 Tax=candidate division TA06 bacterium ADurb.Bin417 TaxID=1852828 RepID=A0A1V5MKZ3_UNCT6|nr:MAG: hypothetical protein BWY73_00079 [candidate division TA06 bacterium ADurb.Bin417]
MGEVIAGERPRLDPGQRQRPADRLGAVDQRPVPVERLGLPGEEQGVNGESGIHVNAQLLQGRLLRELEAEVGPAAHPALDREDLVGAHAQGTADIGTDREAAVKFQRRKGDDAQAQVGRDREADLGVGRDGHRPGHDHEGPGLAEGGLAAQADVTGPVPLARLGHVLALDVHLGRQAEGEAGELPGVDLLLLLEPLEFQADLGAAVAAGAARDGRDQLHDEGLAPEEGDVGRDGPGVGPFGEDVPVQAGRGRVAEVAAQVNRPQGQQRHLLDDQEIGLLDLRYPSAAGHRLDPEAAAHPEIAPHVEGRRHRPGIAGGDLLGPVRGDEAHAGGRLAGPGDGGRELDVEVHPVHEVGVRRVAGGHLGHGRDAVIVRVENELLEEVAAGREGKVPGGRQVARPGQADPVVAGIQGGKDTLAVAVGHPARVFQRHLDAGQELRVGAVQNPDQQGRFAVAAAVAAHQRRHVHLARGYPDRRTPAADQNRPEGDREGLRLVRGQRLSRGQVLGDDELRLRVDPLQHRQLADGVVDGVQVGQREGLTGLSAQADAAEVVTRRFAADQGAVEGVAGVEGVVLELRPGRSLPVTAILGVDRVEVAAGAGDIDRSVRTQGRRRVHLLADQVGPYHAQRRIDRIKVIGVVGGLPGDSEVEGAVGPDAGRAGRRSRREEGRLAPAGTGKIDPVESTVGAADVKIAVVVNDRLVHHRRTVDEVGEPLDRTIVRVDRPQVAGGVAQVDGPVASDRRRPEHRPAAVRIRLRNDHLPLQAAVRVEGVQFPGRPGAGHVDRPVQADDRRGVDAAGGRRRPEGLAILGRDGIEGGAVGQVDDPVPGDGRRLVDGTPAHRLLPAQAATGIQAVKVAVAAPGQQAVVRQDDRRRVELVPGHGEAPADAAVGGVDRLEFGVAADIDGAVPGHRRRGPVGAAVTAGPLQAPRRGPEKKGRSEQAPGGRDHYD